MISRSYFSGRNSIESNRDPESRCDREPNVNAGRYRRGVRQEEQNHRYRRDYPPLIIPSSYYNIVHVHRHTTVLTIDTLINHFGSCYRYSIDTESDRFTYELALIQVHSIPQHLPSYVVLFEIYHFPPSDSILMGKIKSLFSILFRLGNIIFSWGSMFDELKCAILKNLFTWPVSALLFDLQEKFFGWYQGALPSCKACGPSRFLNMAMLSSSLCDCSNYSPYASTSVKWSLQNAICYTAHRFLDKSSTRKNWSIMLDRNYSPLSSTEQRTRLNYAIYDSFVVTYLHRAIYEGWSIIKFREAELILLFTSNDSPYLSSSTTTFFEDISDDEIETHSTSLSNSKVQHRASSFHPPTLLENISEDESEGDEIFISSLSSQPGPDASVNINRNVEISQDIVLSGDVTNSDPPRQQLLIHEQTKPRRTCRSAVARTRRNRKRNIGKRSHRDQHIMVRQVYHRFTIRQIKHILRDRNVYYVHLLLGKISQTVSIGMKKAFLVDLYFDRIPGDLFNKEHYYRYRRQGR